MGFFGNDKSKSTSVQQTTQTDRRVGATDSLIATEGSTITYESSDPATVQASLAQAFGFGRAAINAGAQINVESLDFGERAIQEALDFGVKAFDFSGDALALTEKALERTQSGFTQGLEQQADLIERTVARGSEDLQGLKGLLTTTAIIAVGAFVLIGFSK